MAQGFDADLNAIRTFIAQFPDVDDLSSNLTSYEVKVPDFGQGVQNYVDGVGLANVYKDKVKRFSDQATKLTTQLTSLLNTIKAVESSYEKAKSEESVSASDVDRLFNSGGTTSGQV